MTDEPTPRPLYPESRVLVPIDLRLDVIQPMRDLERKVEDTTELLREHIDDHNAEKKERDERRARVVRAAKWTLTVVATLGGAIATALSQAG